MIRINLAEMNDLSIFCQAERYKVDIAAEMERKREEKTTAANSNETAKREMASELMMQGFSEKSICKILNLSPDQMPEICSSDDL